VFGQPLKVMSIQYVDLASADSSLDLPKENHLLKGDEHHCRVINWGSRSKVFIFLKRSEYFSPGQNNYEYGDLLQVFCHPPPIQLQTHATNDTNAFCTRLAFRSARRSSSPVGATTATAASAWNDRTLPDGKSRRPAAARAIWR